MRIKLSIIFISFLKINCEHVLRQGRFFDQFFVTRPRFFEPRQTSRVDDSREISKPNCKDDNNGDYCDPGEKYRTISGRCNNLQHPEFGARGQPQPRLMPSQYDDGISKPRLRGIYGDLLPSARHVSQVDRYTALIEFLSFNLNFLCYSIPIFCLRLFIATLRRMRGTR